MQFQAENENRIVYCERIILSSGIFGGLFGGSFGYRLAPPNIYQAKPYWPAIRYTSYFTIIGAILCGGLGYNLCIEYLKSKEPNLVPFMRNLRSSSFSTVSSHSNSLFNIDKNDLVIKHPDGSVTIEKAPIDPFHGNADKVFHSRGGK